eukprot:Gregarina_sp_Poly_1__9089@NODE_556_length_7542_cov_414_325351_g438_i0_p2_GENE_NODE_556_length_7542_cov_414_325351_g438_i0NODE_556_length_7542_cov_414_325351_g438_i0_p2_ORF_typecomplete_len467_score36_17Pacifastin_I/PF05375_13/0_00061Pacifastin_I/PF05375_13/0_00025Pacifastin_I/PF05375_13/3_3e03Pacifastin_I/PF05375_13/3_2e03Pacifastin_I/PF05375_13/1_2e04_NODE_556_length_7542_cov_414_325351_g438_i059977397
MSIFWLVIFRQVLAASPLYSHAFPLTRRSLTSFPISRLLELTLPLAVTAGQRYCPEGCRKFSDGCNTCTCDLEGTIQSCSRRFCYAGGTAKCVELIEDAPPDSPPADREIENSTTTPPPPVFTTSDTDLGLPDCPSNCRIFTVDSCNECFCGSNGKTLWCSKMKCFDPAGDSSPFLTCKQPAFKAPPTIAPTDTSPEPIEDDLPIGVTPEPIPVVTTTIPSTLTSSSIATETTAPGSLPDSDSDACPALSDSWNPSCPDRCSLVMSGCRICSCGKPGGVDWCTPCIHQCRMTRTTCLDIPGVSAAEHTSIDIRIHNQISHSCLGNCTRDTVRPTAPAKFFGTTRSGHCSDFLQDSQTSAEPPGRWFLRGLFTQEAPSCEMIDWGCVYCTCDLQDDAVQTCHWNGSRHCSRHPTCVYRSSPVSRRRLRSTRGGSKKSQQKNVQLSPAMSVSSYVPPASYVPPFIHFV